MRILLLISILFVGITTTRGQAFDCNRFKEGRFRFVDPKYGGAVTTERTRYFQTESNEALKLILRFRISWEDNCSFTLRLDKIIRNENHLEIPSNLVITAKILSTSGNGYVQETVSALVAVPYKLTVTKAN